MVRYPIFHRSEELILRKKAIPARNTDSVQSLQNSIWLIYRHWQVDPKIHIEIQERSKGSQNHLEK